MRDKMITTTLRIPTYLKKAVDDVCMDEQISINQFVLNAIFEKIFALQTFDIVEQRAKKGNEEEFLKILSKVPSNEPAENDKLS